MALPGVSLQLQDKFFLLSRQNTPINSLVCAIGTRNTANLTPDTKGIAVSDLDGYRPTGEADVVAAYGAGSQIHRAYYELISGGANNIALVALPSNTTDTGGGLTSLTSVADGNVFDQAFQAAAAVLPDIIVPWGRGGYPTEWDGPGATPSTTVPFGLYADNSTTPSTSFAVRVANAIYNISASSKPCLGILGVKPVESVTENVPTAALTTYQTFPNLISFDNAGFNIGGTTTGFGMYLVVCSTEITPVGYDSTWGYANGACTLAAQLATSVAYNAPTNKTIFNVNKMRYSPTRAMQANIIAKNVLPATLDAAQSPHWVDGMTFAATNSDYGRITTMRIVFDSINMIRDVAKGFIGRGMTLDNKNSLDTAIRSGLRQMQQTGELLNSDFTTVYTPSSNTADVNLSLTPAFELRILNVIVSLNLG